MRVDVRKVLSGQVPNARRIAWGWLVVGLLGLGFLAFFGYVALIAGEPVYNKNTGTVMTRGEVAWVLAFMACGFGVFAALGGIGVRVIPKSKGDAPPER